MTYITQKNDAVNTSFARNPILLAQLQTLVVNQILRQVSSFEFLAKPEFFMPFLMISKN
jgi:hypothetical protein